MRRTLAAISIGCAAALALSACGGGGTSSGGGSAADGATFTMAISGDPGSLDPATAVQGSTNMLLSFAYDTLVHTDAGGKLVSGLATKWAVKPKAVTFTLAKNATCSDGSAVTPSVVAESVNHYVDPDTKSPLVGVLIPAGVKATADDGAGTVTLSTAKPSQFLLQSTVAMFIECGTGLKDQKSLAKTTSGSGPYKLTESVSGDHYTLTARKGYTWGPGGSGTATSGVPAKVILRVVEDESTAANMLTSGDLNTAVFTGADRERAAAVPGVNKSTLPDGNGEFFYNQGGGHAGADQAVRVALTKALDLAKLAKISTQGTGKPTTGMTTLSPRPCRVNSVTGHRPTYDVQAAKAMLDKAGWRAGAGGVRAKDGKKLTMRIVYNNDFGPGEQAGAEFMAAAWKKVGVAVELKGQSAAAWNDTVFTSGDWDVSDVPIGVSLPSQLLGYLSGPAGPKGSNFAHIDNSGYDRLSAKAGTMTVDGGACEVWAQAESALFADADVVPVVERTQLVASQGATVVMPGGLAQPTKFRMLKG